jgi:hypothetical protein
MIYVLECFSHCTHACSLVVRVFSYPSTSLPFSYVESTAPTHFRPDLFERDPKVGVALEAHYGPAHLGVPNFAVQLATLVNERAAALGKSRDRVLDIGCVSLCGLVHPSMSCM